MKVLYPLLVALICTTFSFGQNVGIGTTSPTSNFHTLGTVRFQSLPFTTTDLRVLTVDPSGNVSSRVLTPDIWDGDDGNNFAYGPGIFISGTTIFNTGDIDPNDDLTVTTIFAGDVTGTFNNMDIAANTIGTTEIIDGSVMNTDLGQSGASDGEVLVWNQASNTWQPQSLPGTDDMDWTVNGSDMYTTTATQVGINNTNPIFDLDVQGNNGVVFAGTFGAGVDPVAGAGTRMLWSVKKAAFRAGRISGSQWNPTSIGNYSFAAGVNNTASGYATSTFGANNAAVASYSFAMGSNNTSNASYSLVLGSNNIIGSGGSNGFVGGSNNSLNSSGAIVAGTGNYIAPGSNYHSVIVGGQNDTIMENTILGGYMHSTIAGGRDNKIEMPYSFIGGGIGNKIEVPNSANTSRCVITGGSNNRLLNTTFACFIGGGDGNWIDEANEAVITGGGNNYMDGASNSWSFIGGGSNNGMEGSSGQSAIVSGSGGRLINSSYSFIGTGSGNEINGANLSIIPGGSGNLITGGSSFVAGSWNTASGTYSTILGHYGNTNQRTGCFVYADRSSNNDVMSTANNQFMVRAAGGTIFYSNSSASTGVRLNAGGGAWATLSDVNTKEHFTKVNKENILQKISQLDVTKWNYKSQDEEVQHIGPMAQDFYQAFELGESNKTITTTDIDGINMLGIQALEERTNNQATEIEELKQIVKKQQAQIQYLIDLNNKER